MATQVIKNNATFTATLKKQAIILNKELLKASNEWVDGSVVAAEKWQNLTERMVKTGLKMFSKQQDLLFNTLETVKGQVNTSAKRFNKLVGNDAPKKAKRKVAEATVEMTDNEPTLDSIMEALPQTKKTIASKKKA